MSLNKIIILYLKQGGKCFYCQSKFDFNHKQPVTSDHMTPLSRGGPDTMENKCLSCQSCNSLKGSLTPQEFFIGVRMVMKGELTMKELRKYSHFSNGKFVF